MESIIFKDNSPVKTSVSNYVFLRKEAMVGQGEAEEGIEEIHYNIIYYNINFNVRFKEPH